MNRVLNSLNKNIRSYRYALRGLSFVFRTENNMIYHSIAAFISVVCGLIFQISNSEWIAIFLACGLVFMAEIFNTALEKLLDFISPEHNTQVGLIKDISAAAVLTISIAALLVGTVIFIPKIFSLLNF
ncbi:MAG: diacylglycerol kinase [Bacteroidia bacterium]|jgi:diacylglycerol kinase